MFHLPPGVIGQQLVLVHYVSKMVHALIKIRETYYSYILHLHATLTTVNSLNI